MNPAPTKINKEELAKASLFELIRLSSKPYRQLFAYMKPYRGRFLMGLLFGALAGAVNGVLPLVMHFVASNIFVDGGGQSDLVKAAKEGTGPGVEGFLLPCLAIPAAMILRGFFSYLNAYCLAWVGLKALNDLRRDLFGKIIAQSLGFFNKQRGGMLVARVMMQTRMAQQALTTLSSDLIKQPVNIVVGIGTLFFLDWKFTIIALVLFPLCLVPMAVYGKRVRNSGKAEEEEAGMMAVILTEALQGVRIVKSFAREKFEVKRFNTANQAQFRNALRVRKSMEIVGPLVEVVAALGAAMALLYVYFSQLPVALFMALLTGLFLLYDPIKTLSRLHILMQKCLAATINIFELMETKEEIVDPPDGKKLPPVKGNIRFIDVSFTYPKSAAPAISQVSINMEAGRYYALVGSSGAGKSTMLSMILRFYDPHHGVITIDGHDIRHVTQQSLRSQIGVVTQDTFLFHDTIANNIRYGKLEATQEDIENAARLAYAHDFILAQPDGYNTVVGDKGCMLSGGQQQRLAIARALLKNAPILLLDEATSALDSESEKIVQAALEQLTRGRTVIAIAHRLSTILKADCIVVMDQGWIVAQGTHSQLLESSDIYRRLYELQFAHGHRLSPENSDDFSPKASAALVEAFEQPA
ncbi:MAG: ABC transporter ATP-binding protein [Verrucomicrobiia bacterium]